MDLHKTFLEQLQLNCDPTELFEVTECLGEGSYGEVFKAINKKKGEKVAIKMMHIPDLDLRQSLKEIAILKACQSPYIISYEGAYYSDSKLWMVMEFCEAGSAVDIIHTTNRVFTELEIASILEPVLKGISYLHKNKMIHRDIKGANILIDIAGNVKIADFGVVFL